VSNKLRAPFPWFGGKSRAAHLIWERLGQVPNYIEPFAGSMAVLLGRPHDPDVETINDKDAYVANFWRAVPAESREVAAWATRPVIEADLHARHNRLVANYFFRERIFTEPEYFDSKVAGWWVWGIALWIGSGWCHHPDWTERAGVAWRARGIHTQKPILSHAQGVHCKKPKLSHFWAATGVDQWMDELSARLCGVRVCCGDWLRVLTPDVTFKLNHETLTGVLLDPP